MNNLRTACDVGRTQAAGDSSPPDLVAGGIDGPEELHPLLCPRRMRRGAVSAPQSCWAQALALAPAMR